MDYQIIKVGELIDFVESEDYKKLDHLPISPHRAISQYHNPRADKNDVALIIARRESNVLAYIGALPDILKSRNNEKVAWLSCWKSYKNSGARQAVPILKKMLAAYDNKVLFGDMTPTTKNIYAKLGIGNFFEKEGLKAYIQLDLKKALARRMPNATLLRFLSPVVNALFNLFLYFPRVYWKAKIQKRVRYNKISEINIELNDFIQSKNQANLVQRDGTFFNWMKSYPWILPLSDAQKEVKEKYFFSAYAKEFDYAFFEISKQNQVKAFVFILVRDSIMKVPYAFYTKESIHDVVHLLYNELLQRNASMLEIFHADLIDYIKTYQSPFFYTRKTVRNVGASKTLNLKEMPLYDGDGDVAFT